MPPAHAPPRPRNPEPAAYAPAPQIPSRARMVGLTLALGLCATAASTMQSLAVPILPLVQEELGTSAVDTGWLTTATLLAAAISTPLFSRLGDQHGRRPVLLAVTLLTLAGSLLASVSDTLPLLITGRALQGTATALFPLALSVLRDQLPPARLPVASGFVSGMLMLGYGNALAVGGLLTQGPDPDYHRVFWLAAALATGALLAVLLAVPRSAAGTGGRTDGLGALTLGAALVLLLLPVTQGGNWGWTSAPTLGCLLAAAATAALWVRIERRVPEPMVDMRMFVLRPVLFTNIAAVLLGITMFTLFVGFSALVRVPREAVESAGADGFGFGASIAGAGVGYLLPCTLAALAAAQLGGLLVRRVGPSATLATGGFCGVAGYGWLALAGTSSTVPAQVVVAGMCVGVAIGFAFASLPAFINNGVRPEQSGIANGMNSISRSVGSSVGSAAVTSLLASRTLTGLPEGTGDVPAEGQFTAVFALGALACLGSAVVALTGLGPGRVRARDEAVS
ncbi:MFS transporter [Streptomyces sp. HNM0574]|uniref:MFS transporter n=1 Tax=Streptomyces sp. HNM0574 TaxID=2714954 RepID=UPI00146B7A6E|nr:MFS transporter [Streptomyces sp. HNM0574]NLU68615.1 MFS transporter [Streptomyces sp. HNM0574]